MNETIKKDFFNIILRKLKKIDKECREWFMEYSDEDFNVPQKLINELIDFIEYYQEKTKL